MLKPSSVIGLVIADLFHTFPDAKPDAPERLVWHHPGLFHERRIRAGLTSGCIRGRPALPRKK